MKALGALAGSSAFLGYDLKTANAEPPPETKKIRLIHVPAICGAPQYIAEGLLRSEGFTDVEYVRPVSETGVSAVAGGRADMTIWDLPTAIPLLDQGKPTIVLAGIHSGCWDLYGNERVQKLRDLKGKRVSVYGVGGGDYILLSSMLAYVGIDPRKDIKWVSGETMMGNMQLFEQGKADAFMAFEPQQQQLQEKKLGRMLINTAKDRPWSQHFCCMLHGNKDFVRNNPIATKRAIRAILKGADACTQDPERAARVIVEKGFSPRYDFAVAALKAIPYGLWRSYDPEATLRFYALRLHEVGMLKSKPIDFVARSADWRFLNDLKRQLKV